MFLPGKHDNANLMDILKIDYDSMVLKTEEKFVWPFLIQLNEMFLKKSLKRSDKTVAHFIERCSYKTNLIK